MNLCEARIAMDCFFWDVHSVNIRSELKDNSNFSSFNPVLQSFTLQLRSWILLQVSPLIVTVHIHSYTICTGDPPRARRQFRRKGLGFSVA